MPDAFDLPGEFRQIGYVVRDLDVSMTAWLRLGVGPFFVMRDLTQEATYRGQPCSVRFAVAFANNGELQIELIQPLDDTPSIYTEFLGAGNAGLNQYAWWAPDFPATIASAEAAGWTVVWSGGGGGGARYAYLEVPDSDPAAIVEIMEITAATDGMARIVRDAAAGWDGSDPIRSFGS